MIINRQAMPILRILRQGLSRHNLCPANFAAELPFSAFNFTSFQYFFTSSGCWYASANFAVAT